MLKSALAPTAVDTAEARWASVLAHSAAADFVYAVATTGIYCRPSCAARRPRRENVRFFDTPGDARGAGFRPCRRCRPDAPPRDALTESIRRACAYIERYDEQPPTLGAIAEHVGLSPFHLQRAFKKSLGVSPKEYAQQIRGKRFKKLLRNGSDVTGAIYEAGFGAPSRVYENTRRSLGMTPATYKKGGAGAVMHYAFAPSDLGLILVAATGRGVCFVALGDDRRKLAAELRAEFPQAAISPDGVEGVGGKFGAWVAAVVRQVEGKPANKKLPLDVRATAFQWRVWRELCEIPQGETRTYSAIAARLGKPSAQRAVGRACATNPVSIVVPCHRAIREDGGLGGYRWGLPRKEKLLAIEAGGRRRRR
ncbi:MAG: bifunctional DNA-binding transcriptional regulator/O6-methylguanine-DNA methyltransferase Ada [Alphaproteobacteria bacterium]